MNNTLQKRLSADAQIELLNQSAAAGTSFIQKMKEVGAFPLKPRSLEILQINVGYMCNMECTHCHVDSSPRRKEITPRHILEKCLEVIDSNPTIKTVDLTGGAPEMNPDFQWLIQELAKRDLETIVRSNLTILVEGKFKTYPAFLAENKVTIISSLPCYTEENTDAQRGDGTFNRSIQALKILNELGYGKTPELPLHLVYNPGGPFVAPNQAKLQADYKRELGDRFGIEFHNLYTITNLPISRYMEFLEGKGKLNSYIEVLANSFNPSTTNAVMCTNTLSVDWNGNLFDCDFNQILKLPVAVRKSRNIMDFDAEELANRTLVFNQHCFGCTAGEGSSCQGALT
jgi:radical SAM/Cys-rich protein